MKATKSNAAAIERVSSEQALALLEAMPGPWVFDTETTGLRVRDGTDRAVYLGLTPLSRPRFCAVVQAPFSAALLAHLATRQLIGHNARFDLHALGLTPALPPFDTMLWVYGFSTTTFKSLDDCAPRLGLRKLPTPELILEGRIKEMEPAEVAEYLSDDCAVTAALFLEQQRVTISAPLVLFDCLTDLAVGKMERRGVRLLREPLASLRVEVEAEVARSRAALAGLGMGLETNIGSPAQVRRWFERAGVRLPNNRKTGKPTTGKEALETLERAGDARAAALIEARGALKLLTAFLNPLPGMVDADGMVYASVKTAHTKTGRFSYEAPNLQQVPKHGPLAKLFRQCFTSRSGRVAGADFSQVEMRVAAALSGDPALCAVFDAGEDLHTSIAAQVMGKALADVTPEERFKAKAVNFGILNGMGVKRLAHKMRASELDAQRFLHQYRQTFDGLNSWMEGVWRAAECYGVAKTIMGRTRVFLKDEDTRPAISVIIQGGAADLMRVALQAVEAAGLAPILVVHDEILCDAGQRAGAGLECAAVMETAANDLWQRVTGALPVRFLAVGGEGETWAAVQEDQ